MVKNPMITTTHLVSYIETYLPGHLNHMKKSEDKQKLLDFILLIAQFQFGADAVNAASRAKMVGKRGRDDEAADTLEFNIDGIEEIPSEESSLKNAKKMKKGH
ncbi:hypothetical protein HDV00_008161 [Rhizophlyctis rosea]|nr:hypothetical protein HDV00_008161 [Rhizophlyctis rosea]